MEWPGLYDVAFHAKRMLMIIMICISCQRNVKKWCVMTFMLNDDDNVSCWMMLHFMPKECREMVDDDNNVG